MSSNELIPLQQAAKVVAKGEPFIRRGLNAGRIEGCKQGRDWFLTRSEVARLANEYPLETLGVSA